MPRTKADTICCAECEKEYTKLRDFVGHCLNDCPSCRGDYGKDGICYVSVQMALDLEDFDRLTKGLTAIIEEWRRVHNTPESLGYRNGIEFCLEALGFEL